MEKPSLSTERRWLAQGLADGLIREETGAEIFTLFARIATKNNDVPVYPTEMTKLLREEEQAGSVTMFAEAACDVHAEEVSTD